MAATKHIAIHLAEQLGIRKDGQSSRVDHVAMSAERQPRARGAPLLLPTYKCILQLPWRDIQPHLDKHTLRVRLSYLGTQWASITGKLLIPIPESSRGLIENSFNVPVGVFYSPWEMVREAAKIQSPFLFNYAVTTTVAECVINMLEKGYKKIKQDMFRSLADVRKLQREFRALEYGVQSHMHQDVKAILNKKSTILLEHLVKKSGVVDDEFFMKLRQGFPLTGHVGPTGRWRKDIRLATMTSEEHKKASVWIRESVVGKCKSCTHDNEARRELERVTKEELDAGYLEGPFSVEEAVRLGGPYTTFARRFIIKQKDKWRPIDDFTVSRVNMCLTTVEKARVDSLDDYLCKAKFFLEASRSAVESGFVTMPDGSRRRVVVHSDWLEEGALEVQGRCLDLSNAYKQFPVDPTTKMHTAIAVPSGKGEDPIIYFTKVLPFGATASVYYFLRFSEMLKNVLLTSLGIVCSAYFDDFPCVTFKPLATATQFVMEGCLDTMGFAYSLKDHKRLPFASTFNMLGVVVSFPKMDGFFIKIGNTKDRKDEVATIVNDILMTGGMTQAEAASLSGRIGFLSSQVWSRVGQVLVSELKRRALGGDQAFELDDGLRDALQAAVLLLSSPPRLVGVQPNRQTTWMFTDAACEPVDSGFLCCTLGGVLLDAFGRPSRFFSCEVPGEVSENWSSSRQPITYAESLAALVGKLIWKDFIKDSYLVLGLDNIAAQQSLARYSSNSRPLRMIIRAHLVLDASLRLRTWVAWVPSESNIADSPSRLACDELRRNALREDYVVEDVWTEVGRLISLSSAQAALEFNSSWGH